MDETKTLVFRATLDVKGLWRMTKMLFMDSVQVGTLRGGSRGTSNNCVGEQDRLKNEISNQKSLRLFSNAIFSNFLKHEKANRSEIFISS